MGDNIRDAALKGVPAPVARLGWSALASHAAAGGTLVNDYGTTCLRLKGNRLLIDRTSGFSEDEFYRLHREYAKLGLKDVWVLNFREFASLKMRDRYPDSFMVMIHPDSKKSHFLIKGKKITLAGGINYAMTGELDHAQLFSRKGITGLQAGHHGPYPKITVGEPQAQPA